MNNLQEKVLNQNSFLNKYYEETKKNSYTDTTKILPQNSIKIDKKIGEKNIKQIFFIFIISLYPLYLILDYFRLLTPL
jgi:hypothetical protein